MHFQVKKYNIVNYAGLLQCAFTIAHVKHYQTLLIILFYYQYCLAFEKISNFIQKLLKGKRLHTVYSKEVLHG